MSNRTIRDLIADAMDNGVTGRFKRDFLDVLDDANIQYYDEMPYVQIDGDTYLVVAKYEDVVSAIEDLAPENSEVASVLKWLNGLTFYIPSESEVERLMDAYFDKHPEKRAQLDEYVDAFNLTLEEFYDEIAYGRDLDAVGKEIEAATRVAIYDGTEAEIERALEAYVDDMFKSGFRLWKLETGGIYDNTYLLFKLDFSGDDDEFLPWYFTHFGGMTGWKELINDTGAFSDIVLPLNGFYGFDEEAGVEYLEENLVIPSTNLEEAIEPITESTHKVFDLVGYLKKIDRI